MTQVGWKEGSQESHSEEGGAAVRGMNEVLTTLWLAGKMQVLEVSHSIS